MSNDGPRYRGRTIWRHSHGKMRSFSVASAVAASGLICNGCTVVKSDLVSQSPNQSGLVYSLPMGQIQITASRLPMATQSDVDKAQAAVNEETAAVAKDNSDIAAAKGDATKLPAPTAALATDNATLSSAQAALKTVTSNLSKWQETATITVLPIAPDPTARYVADLNHDPLRDDTLNLTVVNGLLSSSSIASIDETPNIIVTVADTVITALAMLPSQAPPGGGPAPAPAPAAPQNCSPYSISEVFDPLNLTQLNNVNNDLYNAGATIQLNIPALTDPTLIPPAQGIAPTTAEIGGIVYRVATPVVVRVVPNTNPNPVDGNCTLAAPFVAQSISAFVPDTRSRFVVSSQAGPFTTTNLSFGFSNGLLTTFTAQRPSEVAAIAGIPIKIANDIMTIPTQIVEARVNYDTQAAALVNEQTTLKQDEINQSAAVDTALTSVVNAQTALQQAEINQPAAIATAQAALLQAQTGLEQADLGRSTAVTNALTAIINAQTAMKQAEIGQPTAVANAQTSLLQAQQALQSAQQTAASTQGTGQ